LKLVMSNNFRFLNAPQLLIAMAQARLVTVGLLDDFASALRGQEIDPQCFPEVNPPLWEFGHVAWFQEYWTLRNPQRDRGVHALPDQPHLPSNLDQADQRYNSAVIAPTTRWQIDLEPYQAVRNYLIQTDLLCRSLIQAENPQGSDALYFYRLVLAHELMHAESLITSAQSLGFELRSLTQPCESAPQSAPHQAGYIHVLPTDFSIGPSPSGFSFDNELPGQRWKIDAFEIDSHVINHGQFADFVADGGYQNPVYWSAQGRQWLSQSEGRPRYWRSSPKGIERCWFGQWSCVDSALPMTHVNLYEAQAWCAWAGRQLPTEGQWLAGAQMGMVWGSAWEWTQDPHLPFSGYARHPYRDYSFPWFGDHQILKGASGFTPGAIHDLHYRNFFRPHRNDIPAGFRSVLPVLG